MFSKLFQIASGAVSSLRDPLETTRNAFPLSSRFSWGLFALLLSTNALAGQVRCLKFQNGNILCYHFADDLDKNKGPTQVTLEKTDGSVTQVFSGELEAIPKMENADDAPPIGKLLDIEHSGDQTVFVARGAKGGSHWGMLLFDQEGNVNSVIPRILPVGEFGSKIAVRNLQAGGESYDAISASGADGNHEIVRSGIVVRNSNKVYQEFKITKSTAAFHPRLKEDSDGELKIGVPSSLELLPLTSFDSAPNAQVMGFLRAAPEIARLGSNTATLPEAPLAGPFRRVENPQRSSASDLKKTKKQKPTPADWAARKTAFKERRKYLMQVGETLRKEFTDYDAVIDQVINRVIKIELFPDQKRPLRPIVLIGLPGIGKSLFVERVTELLKLSDKQTYWYKAEPGDTTLPMDGLYIAAEHHRQGGQGVSGVFVTDEVQRIYAPGQNLDWDKIRAEVKAEVGDDASKIEYRIINIKDQRNKEATNWNRSIETIREATSGQGYITGKQSKPVSELMKPIDLFLEKYAEALPGVTKRIAALEQTISWESEKIAELENQLKSADQKDAIQKDIDLKRKDIQRYQKEIDEAKTIHAETAARETQLASGLGTLFASYPQTYLEFRKSFGKFERFRRPEKVIMEKLIEDPEGTIEKIKKGAEGLGVDPRVYTGNVLWFLMGNDVDYNEAMLKEADIHNPDSIRETDLRFWETKDAKHLTTKFAHQILGNLADWASLSGRLNFPWRYQIPWGKSQWRNFTQHTLKKDAHAFSKTLYRDFGHKARITYDPSVEKVLYEYGVRPVHGPRVMANAPDDLFGTLQSELIDKLLDGPATRANGKAHQITVRYDYQKKEFQALKMGKTGVDGKRSEILLASVKADALERGVNPIAEKEPTKEEPIDPQRLRYMARREAARLIIGSLFMGSVPKQFKLDTSQSFDPEKVWPHPDPENLKIWEHRRNQILVHLAGPASDAIQFSGDSKETVNDIRRAKESLAQLKSEMENSAKIHDFDFEKTGSFSLSSVVHPSRREDLIIREILSGKPTEGLKKAKKDLMTLLQDKNGIGALYDELSDKLIRQETIETKDFQSLFRARKKVKIPEAALQLIRETPAGTPALTSCPFLMDYLKDRRLKEMPFWKRWGVKVKNTWKKTP